MRAEALRRGRTCGSVRAARWRLRIEGIRTFRAGEEEESPSGGFGMSCADGAQEDRPRPSCESPRPEERRRGLLLSSGLHSTSAACVPWRFGTVAQFRLVQRRMEQVPSRLSHVDLQGAISMLSGSFCFVACSSPDCASIRVSPFSYAEMKVQRVRVRLGSYTYAVHLH